jgi:hypothetical protein
MTLANLNTLINYLCDTSDTQFTAANKLILFNSSYERVAGWLINADGTAQFDDTNYSNFPVGTYTMVAGQGKYSFNDKFLQFQDAQVKDAGGSFNIIKPIDQSEFGDIPLREAFKTDGLPIYYDKLSDDTIELFPAPSAGACTLISGLRIYFKRTASIFSSSDWSTGTSVPGFASPYHEILAYMVAVVYCQKHKKDRVPLYEKRIDSIKKELIDAYSAREKDKRHVMTMEGINFR